MASVELIMPKMGESITEATILSWLKKPGDKIVVNYRNRTGEHETTIALEESPSLEVVTYEKVGKNLTKEQTDFRNNWLSTKVK